MSIRPNVVDLGFGLATHMQNEDVLSAIITTLSLTDIEEAFLIDCIQKR